MTNNRFIYFILSAFIAGNLLLIFVQYNSAKNIHNLITGNKKLLSELKEGNQLREIERNLLSVENRIRPAAAANDSLYLEGVDEQLSEAKGWLTLLKAASEQDSTVRNINRFFEVADEKLTMKNRILDSFRYNGGLSQESFKVMLQRRRLSNEVNELS